MVREEYNTRKKKPKYMRLFFSGVALAAIYNVYGAVREALVDNMHEDIHYLTAMVGTFITIGGFYLAIYNPPPNKQKIKKPREGHSCNGFPPSSKDLEYLVSNPPIITYYGPDNQDF